MSIVDSDNLGVPPAWEKISQNMQIQKSSEQHRSQKTSEDAERISTCSTLAESQSDEKELSVQNDIADNRSAIISVTDNSILQKDVSLPLINGIQLLSIDIKSDDGFTENECDSSDDLPTELVEDKTDLQVYSNTSSVNSGEISNGLPQSVMTELTCDTRLELKINTPDSGLSSELNGSDAGSSCASNRSNDINNDFLKSPVTSEASIDNSKDFNESFSETADCPAVYEECDTLIIHEFEIPQELCGLLIGKSGRHVRYIKDESNADILIKRHPIFPHLKSCAVSGNEEEVDCALTIIRERFPIDKFPNLSMVPINDMQHECPLPITVKLSLPEGVRFEAVVSNVETPGYFFVHQPTHPTYHTLSRLSNEMTLMYNTIETPSVFRISPGFVVATPLAGGWYRSEILEIAEDGESTRVKLLDFGGFAYPTIHEMRQMRYEYSFTPFQATECFLGNVEPAEGEAWSEEAIEEFKKICINEVVTGYVTGYGDHNIPHVHLFKSEGSGSQSIFINEEMVKRGFGKWINPEESVINWSLLK